MLYVLELDHLSDCLQTTAFCTELSTTEDHNHLQQDLSTLVQCTRQWQMILNPYYFELHLIFITIFGYLLYQ